MNVLKLLTVGAVVGLLGTNLRAEEKVDYAKLLLGKWEATKVGEGGLPKGAIVEFLKDNKVKVTAKKDDAEFSFDGTYKLSGNKFTVTMKIGDMEHTNEITIKKISEKELSTEDKDGKAAEFTKKK